MISETIFVELDLGVYCFVSGFLLIASYDLLKICRYIIRHSYCMMGIEDVIYWSITGFFIFKILYSKNNGILRGYAIGAMFLGMVLYTNLISRNIVPIIYKSVDFLKKKAIFFIKRLKKT